MTSAHLEVFDIADLKAGNIICFPCLPEHQSWSRFAVYEITKRLIKTYVLLDKHNNYTPGTLYNFQIIDMDPTKWRLVA